MAIADLVQVTVKITSVSAIILHNGQLADPMNRWQRALKAVSGKRDKTDEDFAALARLEWWGGIYLSAPAEVSKDGLDGTVADKARVILPATMLDGMIRAGARKLKKGKDAGAGLLVEADAILTYDGPKNPNALAKDDRFRRGDQVVVSGKRVTRTRPTFTEWSAEFTVSVEPDVLNPETVKEIIAAAGKFVGLGDWRPGAPRSGPFGRFTVT
jgi:hypothetical protein